MGTSDNQFLCQVDPWSWAFYNKIQLQGTAFGLTGHTWQVGPMQSTAQSRCARKAAQMGWSELEVLRTTHGLINKKYAKGVLYLFPTSTDVCDFSKARFAPLIANNPETIGRYVRDTDSVFIKKVGDGMLYLRGARLTTNVGGVKRESGKLRIIPVDKVVFDERDLIDDRAQDLARERMSHSDVKEEVSFSTPTIPDYGIDKEYNDSDQRLWMIRCQHCNTDTCLEVEFPNCIKDNKRVCIKCGKEIFSKDGRWVAQYPDIPLEGYWISQLNSPFIEPGKILEMFRNPPHGNIQEVYNSKLGMAYISTESRLNQQRVYACCGRDPMCEESRIPTAMGVDVGKLLHVTIGYRPAKQQYKIIKVVAVSSFNDLHDLAKRYNVRVAVLDAEPEIHKVRDFQEQESYRVFLCDYQYTIQGIMWNEKTGIVKVNRTEVCDQTHDLFKEPGICELPRRCGEIDRYAAQLTNIAKVLEEDAETGSKVYRYRKLGADHYRHSVNYFLIAAGELPLSRKRRSNVRFKNWENK